MDFYWVISILFRIFGGLAAELHIIVLAIAVGYSIQQITVKWIHFINSITLLQSTKYNWNTFKFFGKCDFICKITVNGKGICVNNIDQQTIFARFLCIKHIVRFFCIFFLVLSLLFLSLTHTHTLFYLRSQSLIISCFYTIFFRKQSTTIQPQTTILFSKLFQPLHSLFAFMCLPKVSMSHSMQF